MRRTTLKVDVSFKSLYVFFLNSNAYNDIRLCFCFCFDGFVFDGCCCVFTTKKKKKDDAKDISAEDISGRDQIIFFFFL